MSAGRYHHIRVGSVFPHAKITLVGDTIVVNIALDGVHGGPAITREFPDIASALRYANVFSTENNLGLGDRPD